MFLGQIFAKNAKNDPKTLFEASKSVNFWPVARRAGAARNSVILAITSDSENHGKVLK